MASSMPSAGVLTPDHVRQGHEEQRERCDDADRRHPRIRQNIWRAPPREVPRRTGNGDAERGPPARVAALVHSTRVATNTPSRGGRSSRRTAHPRRPGGCARGRPRCSAGARRRGLRRRPGRTRARCRRRRARRRGSAARGAPGVRVAVLVDVAEHDVEVTVELPHLRDRIADVVLGPFRETGLLQVVPPSFRVARISVGQVHLALGAGRTRVPVPRSSRTRAP